VNVDAVPAGGSLRGTAPTWLEPVIEEEYTAANEHG
jgi:hypothetical protein